MTVSGRNFQFVLASILSGSAVRVVETLRAPRQETATPLPYAEPPGPLDTRLRALAGLIEQSGVAIPASDKFPHHLIHYRIPVAGLPLAFDGYTALSLSDLHIERGESGPVDHLTELVSILERERLKPDVCLLSGDLTNGGAHDLDESNIDKLSQLTKVMPCLYVLGNHDYSAAPDDLKASLKSAGFQDVTNRWWSAKRREGENEEVLWLYGVDDAQRGNPIPPDPESYPLDGGPVVYLTHNLDAITQSFPPAALICSGHTHGGDLNLGPVNGRTVQWLLGSWDNLNDQTTAFKFLRPDTLSFVNPGMARHWGKENALPTSVALLTLVPG